MDLRSPRRHRALINLRPKPKPNSDSSNEIAFAQFNTAVPQNVVGGAAVVKATNERHQQVNKTSEAKGGHTTRARAVASRRRRNPQSAEIKLAELRRRLLEISDLSGGGCRSPLGSRHLHAKVRSNCAGSAGRDC